jgi:hypothetical protein
MREPPSDSAIIVNSEGAERVIAIPPAARSTSTLLASAFIMFWLGGWALGFYSALSTVLAGKANAFIIFWLGGWTVGGILASLYLYRMLQPTEPESFRFAARSLFYDSGVAPMSQNWQSNNNYKDNFGELFKKRIRTEFKIEDLRTLRLRETEAENRLTIDQGSKRIEIAKSATEIEREWLFEMIQKHYALRTLNSSTDTRS